MKNKYLDLLNKEIKENVWTGYVTYYPHKKAYKNLGKLDMKEVWKNVKEVNLYVHIPFCDRKCAYCNLFSTVLTLKDREVFYERYVEKVLEEIEYYKNCLDKSCLVRSLYFGGGTPVVLSISQLDRIIKKFKEILPNWADDIEACIECSPERLSYDYLNGLKGIGFDRVSVGVQSFVQTEIDTVNRRISTEDTIKAIENIKKVGLNFNIDLIYGLPHQTNKTIEYNLKTAINLSPQTICIYPLAIRQGTAISKMNSSIMFNMAQKYQTFDYLRDILESNGYTCQTVVRFVKTEKSTYQQQRLEYEGIPTLSVGAGARSYTDNLSYCLTYKVDDKLIKSIIEKYVNSDIENLEFDGFVYSKDEEKRKYIMLNLLDPYLSVDKYVKKFNSLPQEDFKLQFEALLQLNLIKYIQAENIFVLTKYGRKYCDNTVDVFVSDYVRSLYNSYKVE